MRTKSDTRESEGKEEGEVEINQVMQFELAVYLYGYCKAQCSTGTGKLC